MKKLLFILSFFTILIYSNCKKKQVNTPQTPMVTTTIQSNKTSYALGESIEITFSVENTNEKKQRFCYWQTPLETPLTADCFKITNGTNTVLYNGILVKRMPPTDEDYITLTSKESRTNTIVLKEDYVLNEKGIYEITFQGRYINSLPNSNTITIEVK